MSGPLTQGTDYDTSWRADTGGGGTVTTYDVDPITGERKQAATGTTTYGPGSDLLLTADDIAAQIQKEKDAAYADALNVHNIELENYVNDINAADVTNNANLHADAEAANLNNINAGITAINNQEAYNTYLTDKATSEANYQGQLNDFYAANPNYPRYGEEYGQGITSVIPDVAPNVFPVTGGGTDYGSGGNYDYGDVYTPNVAPNVTPDVTPVTDNSGYGTGVVGFDYNPDPYVGVHYDNAADRYAQEMTQANDFGGDYGGGGGGCPAPWIPILLADQTTREAGSLEPGMQVWTQHEKTGEWGAFPITAVSLDYANRWKIELTNGDDFVGTSNHRVLTDKGWVEIQKLKPGARLVQPEGFGIVTSAEETTPGAVVKITVHDAHTYVSSGFVSHNIKNAGDGGAGSSDFNMDEFARGGITSLPKSPGQKLLAAHRAGDMATVHRMLRKVRR